MGLVVMITKKQATNPFLYGPILKWWNPVRLDRGVQGQLEQIGNHKETRDIVEYSRRRRLLTRKVEDWAVTQLLAIGILLCVSVPSRRWRRR